MRVTLGGALGEGAPNSELHLMLEGGTTREGLLAALAEQVPAIGRYLRPTAETGKPVALLIIAGGNWVRPGEAIADDAEVEIYPPISGG